MVSDFNFLKLRRLDSFPFLIYPTYLLVGKDSKLPQPPIESVLLGKSPLYCYYYRGQTLPRSQTRSKWKGSLGNLNAVLF